MPKYSLLHLECRLILIFNLNLIGEAFCFPKIQIYSGGVQHGSGVVTNNPRFADDTTWISEGWLHLNVLLHYMHQFCTWAGIRINIGKSEATTYHIRWQVAISTVLSRIGEGKPTCLLPHELFKYLGTRLNVTGGMQAERMYVIRRSKQHCLPYETPISPTADLLDGSEEYCTYWRRQANLPAATRTVQIPRHTSVTGGMQAERIYVIWRSKQHCLPYKTPISPTADQLGGSEKYCI